MDPTSDCFEMMEETSILTPALFTAGFCFVLLPPILFVYRKVIAPLFFPRRRWIPHPDLPVLNLKGNDFVAAQEEYFSNLDTHLQYGREHVC